MPWILYVDGELKFKPEDFVVLIDKVNYHIKDFKLNNIDLITVILTNWCIEWEHACLHDLFVIANTDVIILRLLNNFFNNMGDDTLDQFMGLDILSISKGDERLKQCLWNLYREYFTFKNMNYSDEWITFKLPT